LATVAPKRGRASDSFAPLIEIWQTLKADPDKLVRWYRDRWNRMMGGPKLKVYETILASYNAKPNGADLLFLCRSCYGGVVRLRKADGYMSTPCGVHDPISPISFNKRVEEWHRRVKHTRIKLADYRDVMAKRSEERRVGKG